LRILSPIILTLACTAGEIGKASDGKPFPIPALAKFSLRVILPSGGGYEHQGHVFKDSKDNTPLSNLFVRILQQIGIEAAQIGPSEGILNDI
jgi:hypothetical protein